MVMKSSEALEVRKPLISLGLRLGGKSRRLEAGCGNGSRSKLSEKVFEN